MSELLQQYAVDAGGSVVEQLKQLARPLEGLKVIHVNSTREGGGVAEILAKLIPLKNSLGMNTSWEVITGDPEFYNCTKTFHNALQGNHVMPGAKALAAYEEGNRNFVEQYGGQLRDADVVFIHDPQPAAALKLIGERKGKWIWRCHIDASHPYRPVWNYLREWVKHYDASIFSLPQFARKLPHPLYIIPPSIDPLADKNIELPEDEVAAVYDRFSLDPARPLITQVSRYDRFKDPVGVIEAFRLARKFVPLQLVLAGGGATDDPEGEAVLQEVYEAAGGDPDVHVLLLPNDAHRTINALQRASDIVLQKSLKEGFGLTVSEAMWKRRPVIGGDVGGIRLQVVDHYTGFLVRSPEGAAMRIRYLLNNRERLSAMGERARTHVRENFLLTRHLKEYLALMIGLLHGKGERIEIGQLHANA